MDSKEVFNKMQEELNSAPRPFENEDWYREGIKAAQEKIIRSILKNNHITTKRACPE